MPVRGRRRRGVGTLIRGLGVDHVLWGTDSLWYDSPEWQIEALRRLENSGRHAEEARLHGARRRLAHVETELRNIEGTIVPNAEPWELRDQTARSAPRRHACVRRRAELADPPPGLEVFDFRRVCDLNAMLNALLTRTTSLATLSELPWASRLLHRPASTPIVSSSTGPPEPSYRCRSRFSE